MRPPIRLRAHVLLVGYTNPQGTAEAPADEFFPGELHRAALRWAQEEAVRLQYAPRRRRQLVGWNILSYSHGLLAGSEVVRPCEAPPLPSWSPPEAQRKWAGHVVAQLLAKLPGLLVTLEVHDWPDTCALLQEWAPRVWEVLPAFQRGTRDKQRLRSYLARTQEEDSRR